MKIVAAFSKRYEPEYLVDELRENLAWCDDIICYDDSTRDPKDTERLPDDLYWLRIVDMGYKLVDGSKW